MTANIQTIIFDLGNVLIPFDNTKAVAELNKLSPGLGSLFRKKVVKNTQYIKDYENGMMSTENFITTVCQWLDNRIDKEKFIAIFANIFSVNDQLVAILPSLANCYQLCVLSNTNDLHREYGWGKFDFLKHFSHIFTSYELGVSKPDPQIYQIVEQKIAKNKNQILFIDDLQINILSAQKRGWQTIHYRGISQCLIQLESLGLKVSLSSS